MLTWSLHWHELHDQHPTDIGTFPFSFRDIGFREFTNLVVECLTSSTFENRNTKHTTFLATYFGILGLEWTTNTCPSFLMIFQFLKFLPLWSFRIFPDVWPTLWPSSHVSSNKYLGPCLFGFLLLAFSGVAMMCNSTSRLLESRNLNCRNPENPL